MERYSIYIGTASTLCFRTANIIIMLNHVLNNTSLLVIGGCRNRGSVLKARPGRARDHNERREQGANESCDAQRRRDTGHVRHESYLSGLREGCLRARRQYRGDLNPSLNGDFRSFCVKIVKLLHTVILSENSIRIQGGLISHNMYFGASENDVGRFG